MPTLIACLSTGKGTWNEVRQIINSQSWDKIFLLTNEFGREKFTPSRNTELIVLNTFQEPVAPAVLKEQIKKALEGRIADFEIALNMISGSGREHMALLEAVMELGLNFRLITVNKRQVESLGVEK